VIPAAGKSSRFGSQKLLADVNGRPLIGETIASLRSGGVAEVVVVLGPDSPRELRDLLRALRVTIIVNPEPERGMFSSIHVGLKNATGDPVLVLPADMPFVQAVTVRMVSAACRDGQVVIPEHDGRRGHPVAIPRDVVGRIVAFAPESTLKDALLATAGSIVELPVQDPGVLRDVDVPGDIDH
jgi:molybdenum cofactor cytidylyltransferase